MLIRRGFTLIELLIVVAIIAILAAIAVPNFLEAQVRAKVSRAKSDMRTLATGYEAYRIDYQSYPENIPLNFPFVVTTPVAYLTSLPFDVFYKEDPSLVLPPFPGLDYFIRLYPVGAAPPISTTRYAILSRGPDTDVDVYLDGVLDPM
ncbi:prepilin-type N-terminal cleavage/methylation domain-containing protein, partial [Candidatus Sumerlaeota bacterium]|nr:prepilin-type N-terminal cleavage/methylation domain-containing protein [Candidatus Sumerlaeota bacterium]